MCWLALAAPAAGRAQAPASQPASAPTTTGSLEPGVYFEEVSVTLRDGVLVGALITSPHDPKVLMGASLDNHLFRSDDGGISFQEVRLPGLALSFPGDGIQQHYPGALRPSPSPRPHPLLRARGEGDGEPAGGEATGTRLRTLMQRAGRPTVGRATIADTLRLRGPKVSSIWFPEFHPTDPSIVWVLTYDGLFTSTDGGWTFIRTWVGKTPEGRATYWISVDPQDPQHYLLATGEGLYVSWDGGRNYLRHPGKMIGDWVVYSADFHPHDPDFVFAQTDHGLLRSADRGRTWELIYFSSHPMGRLSRSFIFDPFDPDRGFLDTNDGLMETNKLRRGRLDDWTRTGGNTFTGTYTSATATCPKHPGHMWTMTQLKNRASFFDPEPAVLGNQFIYESIDGGRTWKVLFSGETAGEIGWFVNDDHDPDLLIIFTDRAAFRMRRGPHPPKATRRPKIPDDPPVTRLLAAALRNTKTSVDDELAYRRRAALRMLVPQLEASYLHFRSTEHGLLRDGLFPTLPFRRREFEPWTGQEFRLLFTWNLGPLIFNPDVALIGRQARTLDALRMRILMEVQEAYGRLRKLRAMLALVPREERRTRLMYRMRIEEIEAYLGRLTGVKLHR